MAKHMQARKRLLKLAPYIAMAATLVGVLKSKGGTTGPF
jgi:hypothetical protein